MAANPCVGLFLSLCVFFGVRSERKFGGVEGHTNKTHALLGGNDEGERHVRVHKASRRRKKDIQTQTYYFQVLCAVCKINRMEGRVPIHVDGHAMCSCVFACECERLTGLLSLASRLNVVFTL